MQNAIERFLNGVRLRFQRSAGFAMSEDGVVGVSVRRQSGGKYFAHLLSRPSAHRGWGVPMEPLRFFARRTVIPLEFAGREAEYIRYNHPELIPLPEFHSIILRFARLGDAGETLLHGIRENRLEEFLSARREKGVLPKLTGVLSPAVSLAAAIRSIRPDLTGKTIAILVGARTTRYLGLKDGRLVNVFDDVYRHDSKNAALRFRKTLQRVLWYMEGEGLGGLPDRVILMGEPAIRSWVEEAQSVQQGVRVEYVDLLSESGLAVPAGTSPEMAILALGAAIASGDPHLSELNFTGLTAVVAARRFDAYDLVMYGSLAVMLALSFITLNSFIATRIQNLRDELRSNARQIQALREEIDGKKSIVPVAEKLIEYGAARVADRLPAGPAAVGSLPDLFSVISETIPDGVRLDRLGSGAADPADESPRGYKSILPKHSTARQITLVGQTRTPEKAMRWVEQLSKRFGNPVVMEEMKLDSAVSIYRFRIVISAGGQKSRA